MECDSLTEYLDLKMLFCSIKGLNMKKSPNMMNHGIKAKGRKKKKKKPHCIKI